MYLFEDSQLKPIMIKLMKKYIKLIRYILNNKEDLKKPTKIWRKLELSGKQSHIIKIIADLSENFPEYF